MNTTQTLSPVLGAPPAAPGEHRREVVALVPAHNEEEAIASTLAGLMTQSRRVVAGLTLLVAGLAVMSLLPKFRLR